MNKACIKCNVDLNLENTTGYRLKNYIYKCNKCIADEKRQYEKELRLKNPELVKSRSRKYVGRLRVENPKKYTCAQMRSSSAKRAKVYELEHNIDTEYVISIAVDICPILNVEIRYGGGEKNDYSASLDRINPKKGYIKGNVQVISLKANLMKSNANERELILFSRWVSKNYSSD